MINVQTENVMVQQVWSLIQNLSLVDQCALAEKLNRQIETALPEQASIEEATALYLADKCSLGRAAELANVTRWDMIDFLKKRNIPIIVDTNFTATEMDAIAKELESEGVLPTK